MYHDDYVVNIECSKKRLDREDVAEGCSSSSRRAILPVMRRCVEKSRAMAIYPRRNVVVVGKVQAQAAKEQSAEQAEHAVPLKDNVAKEAEALWTRAGE
jgi:hypothetical protein